jgi:oxygen-independent coproporphyrinogen-3 oxidase
MVDALVRELQLQKDYLAGAPVTSVYLGGGTPSLLEISEINRILDGLFALHTVEPNAEITLEANPDDLTRDFIRQLKANTPINRLSIGIQSFSDADLQWMNRAHCGAEAQQSLEWSVEAGFEALTIDLIYGAPTTSDADWARNLELAIRYQIPHLSCYALTVEPGTALGNRVRRGIEPPAEEEKTARQFEYLQAQLDAAGYEHYEISNFAKPGREARHNTAYWRGQPYLGIGPSAHSYARNTRQWNVANNAAYLAAIQENRLPFESEVLSTRTQYNEYVLTALRTKNGCSLNHIRNWGEQITGHFLLQAQKPINRNLMEVSDSHYRLTKAGKLLADAITIDLFLDA